MLITVRPLIATKPIVSCLIEVRPMAGCPKTICRIAACLLEAGPMRAQPGMRWLYQQRPDCLMSGVR